MSLRLLRGGAEIAKLGSHCPGSCLYRISRGRHSRLEVVGLCGNGNTGFDIRHAVLSTKKGAPKRPDFRYTAMPHMISPRSCFSAAAR
jgi:hypothetical protein